MSGTEERQAPRVTPSLLRRADTGCPRRLDCEVHGAEGNADPVHRGRLRDAFLAAARAAHARDDLTRWSFADAPAGDDLTEEEVAVLGQAAHWYGHCFGADPVTVVDVDLDRPTAVAGLPARVGGWVDLVVARPDGRLEVRLLDLWGGRAPTDLAAAPAVQCALVRLAEVLGPTALDGVTVTWVDLLHGVRRSLTPGPEGLAAARAAVATAVGRILVRVADPVAVAGEDCATCRFRKGCPEFPGAKRVGRMSRGDLLPGVLSVTPTVVESWGRCPRLWRDQHLLGIPGSDAGAPGEHGQRVHALLRALHRDGPCTDPERITDVVTAHGADRRVLDELRNHARRCPVGAEGYGHEFTRHRLHARPPHFLASARLDAAWIRDGWLDVRDYKTGGVWHARVADDPRARVQAWVMAPVADALGLRLRVRYEHLASDVVDDPEEWEPDADDLAALDGWMVATARTIRSGAPWAGVAEPGVCRTCRYRSICPESAAPGEPTWPRVDPDPVDGPATDPPPDRP